jgi:hypothetical protein
MLLCQHRKTKIDLSTTILWALRGLKTKSLHVCQASLLGPVASSLPLPLLDCFAGVHKELALGLEITELKDEVGLGGGGTNRFDPCAFGGAQVKIELSILLAEPWRPVPSISPWVSIDSRRGGSAKFRVRSRSDVKITDGRLISPLDLFQREVLIHFQTSLAFVSRNVTFPISVDFASRAHDFSYIGRKRGVLVE